MCYDMRCRYQDYEGNCQKGFGRPYPDDAACVLEEKEQQNFYHEDTNNADQDSE